MTHHSKKRRKNPSPWRQSPKRRKQPTPRWQKTVWILVVLVIGAHWPLVIPLLALFIGQKRL